MLELYCERLSKESVVQGDVREGVKESVRAEVGGVRDAGWNRMSPDIYPPPFKGVASQHGERWRRVKWDRVKDYSSDMTGCCWMSLVEVHHQFQGMDVVPRFP